jgi:sulfopyruvate decarboxylase subunit alpha
MAGAPELVRDALLAADLRFVASLPDDWLADLIRLVQTDARFTHVAVAREEEIVGICSGAFFAGVRAVGIMGAAGFLACPHELATLNLMYEIPLLLLISLRGTTEDPRVYQVVQGRVTLPVMEALGIPYLVVERPDRVGVIASAYEHARVAKRPVVVAFTHGVLGSVHDPDHPDAPPRPGGGR